MDISLLYIIVSVLMFSLGQVLLKKGMLILGPQSLSFPLDDLILTVWTILTNPHIVIGLLIYVAGTIFWLVALSHVDLSYAYPFASLSFVIMIIASRLLLRESISTMQILGTTIICIGVILVSRS